jgi:hypothetical protein
MKQGKTELAEPNLVVHCGESDSPHGVQQLWSTLITN